MEIITLVAGSLIGMLGYKIRMLLEKKPLKSVGEEIQRLKREVHKKDLEIVGLKDPKRFIKEFEGDEGSSTGELLKSMKEKISTLENHKKKLEDDIAPLKEEKDSLKSEAKQLEKSLKGGLVKKYDNAIDLLSQEVETARARGVATKNEGLEKLKKQREEISKATNT